jgi:serine/threonine-protein kinase
MKPANLMVETCSHLAPGGRGAGGEGLHLWVTDFGLAHCQSQAGLTMTGDLIGTLRYMSPEQALAQRVLIDHRTDIYSLGVTLYELLTLAPAFGGRDREELLRQIAFEEPKPARRLNRAVPAELETVVGKATEKNPADRYATAQELADDLERFLKDEPIRARRPTLVQRARKWARRHRPAVWATAVRLSVTLLVLGVGIGWGVRERRARRAATAAQVNLALEEARVLCGQQKWREGLGAVKRAEVLLEDGADAESRHRAQGLRLDLAMAVRLDELRTQKSHGTDASFRGGDPRTAAAYATAFKDYGIDVLSDPPRQVADAIRARGIHEQLLAALDDWILVRADAGVRGRLQAVAELADPDVWRNQTRRAVVANDRRALDGLAARAEVSGFPPATGHLLGQALANAGAGAKAVRVLAAVQQRHPQDFWLNYRLGIELLWGSGAPHNHDDAAGYLRAALVARPDYATVYVYLGIALAARGRFEEIVILNRKAIELAPDYVDAHVNLANALWAQGQLAEAAAEVREALRLRRDDPDVHSDLGAVLNDQGRHTEAEAECRKALALRPNHARAHNILAVALNGQGKPVEAEAECREALCLQRDFPEAHYNLGNALRDEGKLNEATAAYRAALRLRPDYPQAHCNLGHVLKQRGLLLQAVNELRRGHELGSRRPGWRYPSGEWVRDAERLVELDLRLPEVLSGETRPKDVAETVNLANLCGAYKRLYVSAVRFYRDAFTADPKLAEDLRFGHRYNAACAAALAGCGRGEDALKLSEPERARLRQQALTWLRADLAAWGQVLEMQPGQAGAAVQQILRHWQQDGDLAAVRGDALAKLPEAERRPWRRLWADVEHILWKVNHGDPQAAKGEPSG